MLNAITATAKKKRVHHNQLKRDHQLIAEYVGILFMSSFVFYP